MWWRQFGSIYYHWYYHIRPGKIQLCSVVPPTKPVQTISSIFSPKIQLGPNWHQSTTKITVAWLRCDADSFRSISHHWYYHVRSGRRELCSVITPTEPAQTISSIFIPNIQLGPNWQQSTTKMAVAGLRCDADSSEIYHIIDNNIYGQEKYSFASLYLQPSQHRS